MVNAEEAISKLKNGNRVFIGSGCGEPQHLIHSMVSNRELQDIMIFQMLSYSFERYLKDPDFLNRFALKLFFVTISMRQAAFDGKIDYIPIYLSEIPRLFRNRQITLDVALIQISPPDRFGLASLGISVDVTREAVRSARLVIAQINPKMPRTHGDSFIHLDDIDFIVYHEEEVLTLQEYAVDEKTVRRIARYISELVDDGSTLQVGYGQIPFNILGYLTDKSDLGIHTHMMTDGFIPLIEMGVATNRKKNFLTDRAVSTFCMGSRTTYDYIDDNPTFYFGTADFVNNPRIIGQNDNFISITSALEVDLTGQVCSDSVGRQFFSGTGDQANFIRGASLSRGGLSIIALPSTAKDGKVSRIVANLSAGAGMATLRADVNFVVTEYGIAQLKGKSISQRVIELTQIAHPDFREALIEAAKRNHYIFSDQLPPPAMDLMFIEKYKSRIKLKNGKTMSVRPLLPSDEIAYRNFLYSLEERTIYYRFFHNINVFTRQMAQKHWANLDYRKNISLAGVVRYKGDKQIMAMGTYAGVNTDQAEVAFMVREDFQGMGIASYLLQELEKIALANGYRVFNATVLADNAAMLQVFMKRYPQAKIRSMGRELEIRMDLAS
ncbi:MAG: GNAT family N-acetyltransferase [Desulfobacteraceae bacterium]|jgi:acyl-CoA hydrolase/GNAT superfamily N-acetyltransferase